MKELSVEQKVKAYNEVLEKAKEIVNDPNASSVWKGWLCNCFPELKEDEDEKIRKEIISFLQLPHPQFVGERKQEKWITWLEKQGEQKPEENKDSIGEISPNWSEEDEHRIKDTVYFLETAKKHYASTEELDACIDWLKSFKGRVQPKQEWNEEEIEKAAQEWDSKANFNPFYMTMEGGKPTGVRQSITTHKESFKAGINWILKSLRSQNYWKPTEEQVKVLEYFVRSIGESGYASPYENKTKLLYSLLEQLKKLRES